MSFRTTCAPACARPVAIASPSPWAAPVAKAVFPLRSNRCGVAEARQWATATLGRFRFRRAVCSAKLSEVSPAVRRIQHEPQVAYTCLVPDLGVSRACRLRHPGRCGHCPNGETDDDFLAPAHSSPDPVRKSGQGRPARQSGRPAYCISGPRERRHECMGGAGRYAPGRQAGDTGYGPGHPQVLLGLYQYPYPLPPGSGGRRELEGLRGRSGHQHLPGSHPLRDDPRPRRETDPASQWHTHAPDRPD